MADPDLQIWEVGGGEGHPDPEIRGAQSLKKIFSALQALVWSKNKRGGGGEVSPGSGTGLTEVIL